MYQLSIALILMIVIMPGCNRGPTLTLLKSIEEQFQSRTLFQWGIVRHEDGLVIGTCTLFHIDESNRRAEIGYALGRAHWGKGYMREALSALLEYAFRTLGLHRIEADVDPRNEASIRLLERLGFQKEGYLRERWLVDGATHDTLFFGLLRKEWVSCPAEPAIVLKRSAEVFWSIQ
jgi:RimJ/RimL family protein N-acetyltransferase